MLLAVNAKRVTFTSSASSGRLAASGSRVSITLHCCKSLRATMKSAAFMMLSSFDAAIFAQAGGRLATATMFETLLALASLAFERAYSTIPMALQQAVYEHGLTFQYLRPRLGNAKPGRAVELRKCQPLPGPWRPLHLECVAPKRRWIPVTLNGPYVNNLAAGLLRIAKCEELAGRPVPGLLDELTQRRRIRGFAGANQSFGNGPDTLIPAAPERPTRVSKQYLDVIVPG